MKHKRLLCVVAVLVLLAGICGAYVNDYYRADWEDIGPYPSGMPKTVEELDDGTLIFIPEEPQAGLIFYPGGKVEYKAYIPLMEALAEEGFLCALVEMPLNLAVLDMNAAEGIPEAYPQVEDWYLAGHSLGGSMAASHLAENGEDYAGLILLGSYSTADLSGMELAVLSIYGSEDRVMNRENYEENQVNLPSGWQEIVLEGGCHAGFGMYGPQDGDGQPTISNEEQIALTAEAVGELLSKA